MGRTIAIWIFGLIGTATLGAGLGRLMGGPDVGTVFGMIGGACGFASLRLWFGQSGPTVKFNSSQL
jgi:hypothetical protein